MCKLSTCKVPGAQIRFRVGAVGCSAERVYARGTTIVMRIPYTEEARVLIKALFGTTPLHNSRSGVGGAAVQNGGVAVSPSADSGSG